MNEFDALLDEILSHDANVEVPSGLERRISSRLATDSRSNLSKRTAWLEAAAAMFVLGLLSMLPLIRSNPATMAWTSRARTLSGTPAEHTLHDGEIAPSASIKQFDGERLIARNAMHSRRRPRATEAGIAPLRIESLSIPPIEIVALNSDMANRKEDLR